MKRLLLLLFVLGVTLPALSSASIPTEYKANYHIVDNRNKILDIMVSIKASKKLGTQVPSDTFRQLADSFNQVFPQLPQKADYKIVYEQCTQLTTSLAANYNYDTFVSFMDNCFDPINDVISDIDNNYTIIPKIAANPTQGSAPLTVTFDARSSTDPSDDTIPSDNFYRYYKDANGDDQTIGQGPVLSHTFTDPGNYQVHMVARSANQTSQGIFDGEKSISVNVSPAAATINIRANGLKLTTNNAIKIGTKEAQKGVVFDATSTIPRGGRTLQYNMRTITSANGFSFQQEAAEKPSQLTVVLPQNGLYKVTLLVRDNENNSITQTYDLIVSDPVATIRQTPDDGNSSTTYNFDASASYSVGSSLKAYTWEISDSDGQVTDTFQAKNFKQQFKKPGIYTIKLTVNDQLGNQNIDEAQINVASTPPQPQFTIQPVTTWTSPSEFILDAGATQDVDVTNGYDSLTYDWTFSDAADSVITQKFDDGKRIIVDFNASGNYIVTLTVKDKFGQSSTIQKTITVTSALRPFLFISPLATQRGQAQQFLVQSNQSILNYNRDFGDGITESNQQDKDTHTYQKIGNYNVRLTVTNANGDSNTVTKKVFIGESGFPIISYQVTDNGQQILLQKDTCPAIISGDTVNQPAYRVERLANFTVDVSDSVDTKGNKSNLDFFFQPKNDEIFQRNNFQYKFSDLGCQYIDVTAQDKVGGKATQQRVWFNVVNALPILDNITMFFPQYGNEVGIGFQNQQDSASTTTKEYDPLIVKLSAVNPRDPDGQISYYQWYYYNKDDPTRLLEIKVTPASVPNAFFSLPRVPGQYQFGVKLVDSDGGENRSEDVIGNGPSLFFPDNGGIDVPIVTLKVDKSNTQVGQEVTFDVSAKLLSDKSDFVQNRTIKYDFDGDGFYDLTTKDDHVTHVYSEPGTYTPRVKVLYREVGGVAAGEKILVEQGLKPSFLRDTVGNTLLFRDTSIGKIVARTICFDATKCRTDSSYQVTGVNFTSWTYDKPGNYIVTLLVQDDFGNKVMQKATVNVNVPQQTGVTILAAPNVQAQTGNVVNSGNRTDIYVGNQLNNAVVYYIAYKAPKKGWDCFFDKDITVDSDGDGNPELDRDTACNQPVSFDYKPGYNPIHGKVFYDNLVNGDIKKVSRDVYVHFIDISVPLSPDLLDIYNKITAIVDSLDPTQENIKYLISNLNSLKDALTDKDQYSSLVVTIRNDLDTIGSDLTADQTNKIDEVLNKLTNEGISAALQGSDYDIAKQEILTLTPEAIRDDVQTQFDAFDKANGNKDLMSQSLTQMKLYFKNQQGSGIIDGVTLELVNEQLCVISNYYSIDDPDCVPMTDTGSTTTTTTTTSSSRSVRGIIGTVFGVLVGIFVILLVIFAVRARFVQKEDNTQV